MLSVKCPNCNATNIFDEAKQIPTFCSFCGGHLPDMTKIVQESLQIKFDKQRHSMAVEKLDKEIKREKSSNFSDNLTMIIVALLTIIIIGFLIYLFQYIHQK